MFGRRPKPEQESSAAASRRAARRAKRRRKAPPPGPLSDPTPQSEPAPEFDWGDDAGQEQGAEQQDADEPWYRTSGPLFSESFSDRPPPPPLPEDDADEPLVQMAPDLAAGVDPATVPLIQRVGEVADPGPLPDEMLGAFAPPAADDEPQPDHEPDVGDEPQPDLEPVGERPEDIEEFEAGDEPAAEGDEPAGAEESPWAPPMAAAPDAEPGFSLEDTAEDEDDGYAPDAQDPLIDFDADDGERTLPAEAPSSEVAQHEPPMVVPVRGYYIARTEDTLRSVAAQFLNAPERWSELRALNAAYPGIADLDPDELVPEGAALALPGDPLPWGRPDPVYLWTLAETFLYTAWGREPAPEEVVPFWRGLTHGALPEGEQSPLGIELPDFAEIEARGAPAPDVDAPLPPPAFEMPAAPVEPEPEIEPEPEPVETDVEPDLEPEPVEAEPEDALDLEPDFEAELEPEPVEPAPEDALDLEPDIEVEPEPVPEPELAAVVEVEPEPVEPAPELEPEPEPAAVVEDEDEILAVEEEIDLVEPDDTSVTFDIGPVGAVEEGVLVETAEEGVLVEAEEFEADVAVGLADVELADDLQALDELEEAVVEPVDEAVDVAAAPGVDDVEAATTAEIAIEDIEAAPVADLIDEFEVDEFEVEEFEVDEPVAPLPVEPPAPPPPPPPPPPVAPPPPPPPPPVAPPPPAPVEPVYAAEDTLLEPPPTFEQWEAEAATGPAVTDPAAPYAGLPEADTLEPGTPPLPPELEAPRAPHFLPSLTGTAPSPQQAVPSSSALGRSIAGTAVGDAMMLWQLARRRRQSRRGAETIGTVEQALQQTAAHESLELIEAAMRHLRAVTIGQGHRGPDVLAVRVGTYGFEVLLDKPFDSPPGWRSASGGYVLELPQGVTARDLGVVGHGPSLCPALVPVGSTHEGPLLLNLEQVGCLAVSGPSTAAASLLRAVVATLGSSPLASDVRITAVGLDDSLGSIGWEAVRFASYDAPELEGLLAGATEPSGAAIELLAIGPNNDLLIQRAGQVATTPGSRLSLVGATSAVSARWPWRIHVDGTGTAVVHPISITMNAAQTLPPDFLAPPGTMAHGGFDPAGPR